MMKYIVMLVFLLPLSGFSCAFWLSYLVLMVGSFLLLSDFSSMYVLGSLSIFMGKDLMSYWMLILSMWICGLMFLASGKTYLSAFYVRLFTFNVIVLIISLLIFFSALNLFIFYVFFEISIVPTLLLIMGWGYQPERLQAGVYLLIYTLTASLPMMVSVFYLDKVNLSMDFSLMTGLQGSLVSFSILLFLFPPEFSLLNLNVHKSTFKTFHSISF